MRAAVQHGYGALGHLEVTDVERPAPGDLDLLVRVRATAVTLTETMTLKGRPVLVRLFSGLLRPRQPVPGSEFAGTVAAVGGAVTRFAVGDEVVGSTGSDYGCFAEYVCVPEDGFVAAKPPGLAHQEAAPVCAGLAAWNFLRDKADLRRGQRVLVIGAAGDTGTMAVQLARSFGADVTAVTGAADMALVRSLGADEVIDDSAEAVTARPETYDVIFDTESESSFARCRRSLTPHGVYLRTFPGPVSLLQMLWTSRTGHRKVVVSATGLLPVQTRLGFLNELDKLIDAGEIRAVVDGCYPLDEITDAYRHAERDDKRGSVVVTQGPTG